MLKKLTGMTLMLALLIAFWPAPARAQGKTIKTPFAAAARGTATSDAFPVFDATTFIAYLKVTAKSGGATSLDVKYQDSPDGTAWFDLTGASFSQVTTGTSSQAVIASRLPAAFVRCVATVAGSSTPTFTFSSNFVAVKLAGNNVINSATDGSTLTGLNPSALTGTGDVPDAAFPATLPAASGVNLTALNASNIASGEVATARLAEDVARTTSVTVATGSVLTLNDTPVTLVAAPGAGKVVLIEEITAKLVFNSIAYTGSNAIEFRYTNGSGAKVTADLSAAFLNSSSGTNYATVKSVTTQLTPVANAAVVVFVPSANPGAGNSPVVFKIKYRIVTP
ncbi:MAG: hypothetical protein WBV94_04490 [Blastocatellia bacterium]